MTPAPDTGVPAASHPAAWAATNWELSQRLLALTWRYRSATVTVIVIQLTLKGLLLVGLGLIGLGIDVTLHHIDPTVAAPQWPFGITPPQSWPAFMQVVAIALAVAALAAARATLQYRGATTSQRLIQQVVVRLRTDAYDKLQRLQSRFFGANDTGSIINRLAGDVQNVRLFVDGVVIQATVVALSLVAYVAFMLTVSAPLTVLCLLSTPLLLFSSLIFTRRIRPAHQESKQLYDQMVVALSENAGGAHVVKAFGLQQLEIDKFAQVNRAVQDRQRSIFRSNSIFYPLMGFLTQVNLIMLLVVGGYLFTLGELSLGTVLVFAWVLQQFSADIFSIAGIVNNIQESLVSAGRVFELVDAKVEIETGKSVVRRPILKGALRFERVTFGYDPGNPVLHDVSFAVEPGECVAVMGATGAGKSTMLSLLPRFHDPQQGVVLVDDIDVRDLRLDDLRRNIGLVMQETFLFSNTIAANVAYGYPAATEAEIEAAAKLASADAFIRQLPQGYATRIGERGGDLSGGQRQRLAIARALLLNPPMLILDDAAAAVDAETEHAILDALDRVKRGRTTLIVAHRLSTAARADRVVVLERGRIVRTGPPAELFGSAARDRAVADLQSPDLGDGMGRA